MDANFFMFKFANKKDKLRVQEGSPWSFDKHLIGFKDYDGDLKPAKSVFDKACFQVRVYGLPLKMMSQGFAERIGKKMKLLKAVEDNLRSMAGENS